MLWLTWRQHRLAVAIGGLVLALLGVALLATKDTVDSYARAVTSCTTPVLCGQAREALAQYLGTSPLLHYLLPAVPLLLGIFVGAPLMARELEQGTHVLVWTQGITRGRWLAVTLGLLCGVTLLAMGLLAVMMAWWNGHADAAIGPWATFDVGGVAPLAYALFALALGTAAGVVVRHSVGAMALTLGAVVATRLAVASGLRPRFRPPLLAIAPFHVGAALQGRDWVLNVYPVDHLGHPLRQYMQIVGTCDAVPRNGYAACLRDHGFFLRSIYQPADRFWLFQGIESAIFLGLAGLVLALTVWWLRERAA